MFVFGGEEGASGDEGVGPGFAAEGAGAFVDAAVDFEAETEAALFAPFVDGSDFFEHVAAEALTAEAGLDGHDENEIDRFQVGEKGVGGGVGFDREAGEAFEGPDFLEGFADRVARFDVDRDHVGAGLGEGINEPVGVQEHQVDVEKEAGFPVEGGDDFGAEGEVGDEVAVHDVDMEPAQAELFNEAGGVEQVSVISRQNGGCEDMRMNVSHRLYFP